MQYIGALSDYCSNDVQSAESIHVLRIFDMYIGYEVKLQKLCAGYHQALYKIILRNIKTTDHIVLY